MTTLLLLIIYLAFISLGLPDSLLGAVWPAAHADIGAPLSAAGLVSVVTTLGTVASSLLSTRLVRRLGTGRLTALCVLLTAGALLGVSFARNLYVLCLLAIPLGLGGGSIDAALNNFVAAHYKAVHMNLLHGFWGVGATVGPLILAAFLAAGDGWRWGYRAVSFIQLGLMLAVFLSLPLWKKTEKADTAAATDRKTMVVDNRVALQVPGVKTGMLILAFYCAAENTLGLWAPTFFAKARGVPESVAAGWASLFFGGIMIGRFLSGFLSLKLPEKTLIRLGIGLAGLGAASLLLPGTRLLPVSLFLCGLGCAPVYPNTVRMVPDRFGPALSQAVIGLMMACSYAGNTLVPPLFGLMGQAIGFGCLPFFVLALLAALLFVTEANNRRFRHVAS